MEFFLDTTEQRAKYTLRSRVQLLSLMMLGFVLFLLIMVMQSGKLGRLEQLQVTLQQEKQELRQLQQETARLEQYYKELRDGRIKAETLAYLSFQQQSLIDENQQVIWLKEE